MVVPIVQINALLLPLNPTFREPIIHKQASKPGYFYKSIRTRD